MGVVTFCPALGFPERGFQKSFQREIVERIPEIVWKKNPVADFATIENCVIQSNRVRSLLSRLVIHEDEADFRRLSSIFRRVSDPVIRRCLHFGAGYYLLSRATLKRLFHDLPGDISTFPGGYSPHLKACVLEKGALAEKFLPFLLLGHAYDHAIGGDHFASLRSPLVQSLYLACKRKKRNHQFMSLYGESGLMEYFAESFAFYFHPDEELTEMFMAFDRSMFDYLAILFQS